MSQFYQCDDAKDGTKSVQSTHQLEGESQRCQGWDNLFSPLINYENSPKDQQRNSNKFIMKIRKDTLQQNQTLTNLTQNNRIDKGGNKWGSDNQTGEDTKHTTTRRTPKADDWWYEMGGNTSESNNQAREDSKHTKAAYGMRWMGSNNQAGEDTKHTTTRRRPMVWGDWCRVDKTNDSNESVLWYK